MQKITPFLWFDNNAEEAVRFYLSVFKPGKILRVAHYSDARPESAPPSWPKPGSVMTVEFELFGQQFVALNGGPVFEFNESVSFVVNCKNQREVDYYWKKLLAGGGKPSQCGWLKDRYGLSWQIVPTVLVELMTGRDAARAARVTQAMLQMVKLDIAKLKQAAIAPKRKRPS
jgi:predicted 3-demethylubiquinone-9 3-methyltransferase (glyoxalase superfamily)